ncbi:hypothetical protein [Serratia rubidaea]|uniref:Uncharacterized protein n=1 Tax=Serratia rubidaea TaxID=61652 RepID=A0ABS0MET5_SERRU|nr:hypothetical protein [Serratia rubidaea]MBH1930885.1 hypothetical protein [Serratia rubidaea]
MKDIYGLVKTVIISEPSNPDAGYKYDIYRDEGGESDHWHVQPSVQKAVATNEGLHHVWVRLSSKVFPGSKELEDIISECGIHFRENT